MKNTVKKQTGRTAAGFAALLALVMCIPFFASCGVPGGADPTSEQSTGTGAPVTMPADPGEPVLPSGGEAVIFEGGKTLFPLIRRDVAGTCVISLYSQIIRAAGGGTGKISAYKGGTDWVKEDTDMTGVPELLLGYGKFLFIKTLRAYPPLIRSRVKERSHRPLHKRIFYIL